MVHTVILATQEAEIRRIVVRSQPWANSSQDPVSTNTHTKNRAVGLAQMVEQAWVPEFKPQNHQKKKSRKSANKVTSWLKKTTDKKMYISNSDIAIIVKINHG
jgi:hypothetical protein